METSSVLVEPNRVDSVENDSIGDTTRSVFRVPVERQIKIERDSFESDCAVGSHKATNETEFSSEDLKEDLVQLTDYNINYHKDKTFVSVKTEAPEDKVFPSGGTCFEDSQPDQDMADPFYEEFLDFNNLFPDLIPGVDDDACQLLPEIPTGLILPKEEPPVTPNTDFMKDLDSILAETERSNSDQVAVDELLNVEVVDEAPLMQDQTEGYSSSVLSPGSVVSLDSCDTSNYPSTYAESTASESIDVDLQHLLDLLGNNPVETATVDAKELFLETSTVKICKRKQTPAEEPVAKRSKPDKSAVKTTTDKLTERRIKNNAASRICRASRKQREEELFKKEEELIESNSKLRSQVDELTKETEALKKIIVQRLSSCIN